MPFWLLRTFLLQMTQGHFKLVRGGGLSSFPDRIAPDMRSRLLLKAISSLLLLLTLSTTLFAAFETTFLFFLFFLLAMDTIIPNQVKMAMKERLVKFQMTVRLCICVLNEMMGVS